MAKTDAAFHQNTPPPSGTKYLFLQNRTLIWLTALASAFAACVAGLAEFALAGDATSNGLLVSTFRLAVPNAYCSVPTFALPSVAGQARAVLEGGEKPIILIDGTIARSDPYARFLLAHECCHHQRGHLVRLKERSRQQELAGRSDAPAEAGPHTALSAFSSTDAQQSMELDADCCAATLLAERDDAEAVGAAAAAMEAYGAMPTGASYPAGRQRARIIAQCGKRE